MASDDEITSKIHAAIVEEIDAKKKRIRLSIDDIGDAFITKNTYPEEKEMKLGGKLEIKIFYHSTGRWLVSDIISIEGEPYEVPKSEPGKKEPSVENKTKEGKEEAVFPNLDQRYVKNTVTAKKKRKVMIRQRQ